MQNPFMWTSALFREMEQFDCEPIAPESSLLFGEEPLIILEDLALRRMYNLIMLYDARAMCAYTYMQICKTRGVQIENPFGDYERIARVRDFLGRYFQISCKEKYPELWRAGEISVRRGWLVVKTSKFNQLMEAFNAIRRG